MSESPNVRLIPTSSAPSYDATGSDLQGDNASELELRRLQREGKVLYDKGACQMFRGTYVCPVGGNEYAVVPQYVKDRVDGELGPQTHEQYPPPCLLNPLCTELCETNACCVCFGRIGDSGPCGAQQDNKEVRRRRALSCGIFLILLAALCFVPVALSVIDVHAVVDLFWWNKATFHITGKRVWENSADTVGTLIKCSGATTNPQSIVADPAYWLQKSHGMVQSDSNERDPACDLTFEYKISPGGTLIDGPADFSKGRSSEPIKAHNPFDNLSMCKEYLGSRQAACTQCQKSMLVQGVAGFVTIAGLIMAINEILARWDRKYDINFTKGSGVIGALVSAPGALSMFSTFGTNCASVLFEKGTGEMARGSYQPASLAFGQSAALEWSIRADYETGQVSILCLLVGLILLLRCLTTLFVPTDPEAGDRVKLTDPWDLGIENLDKYSMEVRSTNTNHQPKWGQHLSFFTGLAACCGDCTRCCFQPALWISDMCSTCAALAILMFCGHLLLWPCTKICPWCFVHRPKGAPAPRPIRGVVREMSRSNGNCEELWQRIKMEAPTQEKMVQN